MGEIVPFMGVMLVILAVVVMSIISTNYRKKVVKPMDEEDMVERIKIKLTVKQFYDLEAKLRVAEEKKSKDDVVFDAYEEGSDRLLQITVLKG